MLTGENGAHETNVIIPKLFVTIPAYLRKSPVTIASGCDSNKTSEHSVSPYKICVNICSRKMYNVKQYGAPIINLDMYIVSSVNI